jgi:DNA-binding XRE family transcriptional regulator
MDLARAHGVSWQTILKVEPANDEPKVLLALALSIATGCWSVSCSGRVASGGVR